MANIIHRFFKKIWLLVLFGFLAHIFFLGGGLEWSGTFTFCIVQLLPLFGCNSSIKHFCCVLMFQLGLVLVNFGNKLFCNLFCLVFIGNDNFIKTKAVIHRYLTTNKAYGTSGHRDIHLQLDNVEIR